LVSIIKTPSVFLIKKAISYFYEETTGGSIVLQKGHQPRALYDELTIALKTDVFKAVACQNTEGALSQN
jgi:hypothetical protein